MYLNIMKMIKLIIMTGFYIMFCFLWLFLNCIALIIAPFRSDWKKIKQDIKMIFKRNNYFYTFGVVVIVLMILPFSIPYSMRNIADRIN